MGDAISPLELKKIIKKEGSVSILENVLFANLYQNIYVSHEMLVRRRLLNH